MKETVAEADGISSSQPARTRNIQALVSFFESGIKSPDAPRKLGIELEHIVVHDDMSPVSYSAPDGIAKLLSELSADYPNVTTDAEGDILGVSRPSEAVTIEPAAQVELSAGPFTDLASAEKTFAGFEKHVRALLQPRHERLLNIGYHPSAPARSLELIPKKRYKFMNRYLSAKDTCGPCMMRGSASTQVSIDYINVEDCLRKLRIAYALVPILALVSDNSPVFEGKKRDRKLVRTYVWEHVDTDRCGLIPGVFDRDFSLERYAEHVLDTPAILVPDDHEQWRYSEQTFGEIYAEHEMTERDVEHAVSMLFPDVRLKTYVEIRPADCMPIPYVIAYTALIKGLFYRKESLEKLDDLFESVDEATFNEAKTQLMAHGYEATVYGSPVAQLCDKVFAIAQEGLDDEDRGRLAPLAELVARRITLADLAENKE